MSNHYQMNPRVDTLKYGHELEEGMLVLREEWYCRGERGDEFAEVTRLEDAQGNCISFFGRYEDGFMQSFTSPKTGVWIVKEGYQRPVSDQWEFKFHYKGGWNHESMWCSIREQEIDWRDQNSYGCIIEKVSFRRAR